MRERGRKRGRERERERERGEQGGEKRRSDFSGSIFTTEPKSVS